MSNSVEILKSRAIITLSGSDRKKLLQGIVTNNVSKLEPKKGLYSALLTPQGKFLHDFFLYEHDDVIYLDCEKERIADLFRRLLMYRLRSDVEIIDQSEKYSVIASKDELLNHHICYPDPRYIKMGYRAIIECSPTDDNDTTELNYHDRRILLGIAEGSSDFIVEKSTILEGSFEKMNGVDFKKGCYVGQEVTARMKYRGNVKKVMYPATLSEPILGNNCDIFDLNNKKVGELRSHNKTNAIALFRINDIEFGKSYFCDNIKITPFIPEWMEI